MKNSLFLVVFACFLILTGCKVQQRPGLTRTGNAYEQYVAVPADRVQSAAEESLRELNLIIPHEPTTSGSSWKIEAFNQQRTQIIVTVSPETEATTRYSVEVKPGQSEGLSVHIIRSINTKLGVARVPVVWQDSVSETRSPLSSCCRW